MPAGLDGTSQFEPQTAGLGPNGKLGGMYGGMGSSPFGGQPIGMGPDKSQTKYGIGGLPFSSKPLNRGANGAGKFGYGGSPYGPAGDPAGGKLSGKYGGLAAGMGGDPAPGYGELSNGGQPLGLGSDRKSAGKYGYGGSPYEAQPVGHSPEGHIAAQYGLGGLPYDPEPMELGHNGKLTGKYGGGEVPYAPQPLGFGDNQGSYESQPLDALSAAKSAGGYETAGMPYEPLPLEPETVGKSYGKEELPTPGMAVEGEGKSIDRYENGGYINGHVQPEVVAFPAAPTPSSTLALPPVPSYVPLVSSFTSDVEPVAGIEDLPHPAGTASLSLASAPAGQTQAPPLLPEQSPRQIHIQQHLKLHFHPQGKSRKGGPDNKYDLNGFFGNSGYQG
ncbi:calymmin isoform X2 [Myripristis murdjan]|uniref:calymmin isoform X2 n=1 Tax=Myripristis murdjan TaxID=586833 RepID=UPI001175DF08|nr:prisilkin-39-like isoform X2 [Myripristis murdjan]